MALPVTSALSRRERLWPAVSASVAAHVVLIAWAVAHRPPPPVHVRDTYRTTGVPILFQAR